MTLIKHFKDRDESFAEFTRRLNSPKRPSKPTSDPSQPWFLDGPMKGKQSAAVPRQRAGETLTCAAMVGNQGPTMFGPNGYPAFSQYTTYVYECLGHLSNGRPIYAYRGSRS